jgi:hypothetical protein
MGMFLDIVMYRPIARQRLSKHIPAQAYSPNIRASIARQRGSKQAFSTIEDVFSAWSVQSGYKEEFSWEELVEFRDASLPGYELGAEELNWVRSGRKMARKELGYEKKASCVIWSDSETVINPLPGYD